MIKRVCDVCGADMPMYPLNQPFIAPGVAPPMTTYTGDICDECKAKGPFANPIQPLFLDGQ